jgi:hypothetical protein
MSSCIMSDCNNLQLATYQSMDLSTNTFENDYHSWKEHHKFDKIVELSLVTKIVECGNNIPVKFVYRCNTHAKPN